MGVRGATLLLFTLACVVVCHSAPESTDLSAAETEMPMSRANIRTMAKMAAKVGEMEQTIKALRDEIRRSKMRDFLDPDGKIRANQKALAAFKAAAKARVKQTSLRVARRDVAKAKRKITLANAVIKIATNSHDRDVAETTKDKSQEKLKSAEARLKSLEHEAAEPPAVTDQKSKDWDAFKAKSSAKLEAEVQYQSSTISPTAKSALDAAWSNVKTQLRAPKGMTTLVVPELKPKKPKSKARAAADEQKKLSKQSTAELVENFKKHIAGGDILATKMDTLDGKQSIAALVSKQVKQREQTSKGLTTRLERLQAIQHRLDGQRSKLQKNLESFNQDGPAVRLKLATEQLKQKTATTAWQAFEERNKLVDAHAVAQASQATKDTALHKLQHMADTGNIDDLTVASAKEIPNMATMASVQAQFAAQLKLLAADLEKSKRFEKESEQNLVRAESAEGKLEVCTVSLKHSASMQKEYKKRYYQHASLERNAKWEINDFKKKSKFEPLKIKKRLIQKGIQGGVLSTEGPRPVAP